MSNSRNDLKDQKCRLETRTCPSCSEQGKEEGALKVNSSMHKTTKFFHSDELDEQEKNFIKMGTGNYYSVLTGNRQRPSQVKPAGRALFQCSRVNILPEWSDGLLSPSFAPLSSISLLSTGRSCSVSVCAGLSPVDGISEETSTQWCTENAPLSESRV